MMLLVRPSGFSFVRRFGDSPIYYTLSGGKLEMAAREIKEKEWFKLRGVLGKKSRLIFDLMWFTGERIGAIVQLRVDDVYKQGQPRQIISFRRSTRKGKDRGRLVATHESLKELLEAYQTNPLSPWLFPGIMPDVHLSRDAAMDALERGCAAAGLEGITSHSFRRAFANRLHRKGYDLRLIQQAMGHTDIRSTTVYVSDRPDAVAAAVRSL